MNYSNGVPLCIGDEVVYAGKQGKIVFVIQDAAFLEGYKPEEWNYLQKGIGVELKDGDLFCLDAVDEDLIKVVA
ncbi:MAG TPA: hypothetical protein VGW57_04695 [Chthoniobacterales bacterium]|nr:hypothetical protein [Chthoniobacterales bacterium]